MVNLKLTFITSDGSPTKEFVFDNFDINGASGRTIRELLASRVNVPAAHLQLFCMGHVLEDEMMLIDLDVGKSVKIMASERASVLTPAVTISSPLSTTGSTTGSATMPTTDVFHGSPPRSFHPVTFGSGHGASTGSTGSTGSSRLFGADIDLAEYCRRLLPLAHLENTSYSEHAHLPKLEGPSGDLIQGFVSLASSSVPPQLVSNALNDLQLPNPITGVSMSPEAVARFDMEAIEGGYAHILQVKNQFEALPDLTSPVNQEFATEVANFLSNLEAVLRDTKNRSLQSTMIAMTQRITSPTFVTQYTTHKAHPIATNPELESWWDELSEARVLVQSAQEAINRDVYTDEVRVALNQVIELAGNVEKLVSQILGKLDSLRQAYHGFPSVNPLRNDEMTKLQQSKSQYEHLLIELQQSAEALAINGKVLRQKYDEHKISVARKMDLAQKETQRLQREQNLIAAAMNILGLMYIEHEVEKQKQTKLNELFSAHDKTLDEELGRLTTAAERHAGRIAAATTDVKAALKAHDIASGSVQRQLDLLQQWSDVAKREYIEQGVRAVTEAHAAAMTKFQALLEIWDSANRSLEEVRPELEKLDATILSASQARKQLAVESARKLKQEYEAAIPVYQERRDSTNKALEHLEQVVFPEINKQLEAYGQAPFPIPSRIIGM